jgi:hypothetical protein
MTLEHEHILGEPDNRHPAASRYVNGTNDLHVLLRNIVCTDSPIGVPPIARPQASLKEREKNFESVAVITEEVRTHIKEYVDESGDVFHEPGTCNWIPCVRFISNRYLSSPIATARPL